MRQVSRLLPDGSYSDFPFRRLQQIGDWFPVHCPRGAARLRAAVAYWSRVNDIQYLGVIRSRYVDVYDVLRTKEVNGSRIYPKGKRVPYDVRPWMELRPLSEMQTWTQDPNRRRRSKRKEWHRVQKDETKASKAFLAAERRRQERAAKRAQKAAEKAAATREAARCYLERQKARVERHAARRAARLSAAPAIDPFS